MFPGSATSRRNGLPVGRSGGPQDAACKQPCGAPVLAALYTTPRGALIPSRPGPPDRPRVPSGRAVAADRTLRESPAGVPVPPFAAVALSRGFHPHVTPERFVTRATPTAPAAPPPWGGGCHPVVHREQKECSGAPAASPHAPIERFTCQSGLHDSTTPRRGLRSFGEGSIFSPLHFV